MDIHVSAGDISVNVDDGVVRIEQDNYSTGESDIVIVSAGDVPALISALRDALKELKGA